MGHCWNPPRDPGLNTEAPWNKLCLTFSFKGHRLSTADIPNLIKQQTGLDLGSDSTSQEIQFSLIKVAVWAPGVPGSSDELKVAFYTYQIAQGGGDVHIIASDFAAENAYARCGYVWSAVDSRTILWANRSGSTALWQIFDTNHQETEVKLWIRWRRAPKAIFPDDSQ